MRGCKSVVLSVLALAGSVELASAQITNTFGGGNVEVVGTCNQVWTFAGGAEVHVCSTPVGDDHAASILIPVSPTRFLLCTRARSGEPAELHNGHAQVRVDGTDLTLRVRGFMTGIGWGSVHIISEQCSGGSCRIFTRPQSFSYERLFSGSASIIVSNTAIALNPVAESLTVTVVDVLEPGAGTACPQSSGFTGDGTVAGEQGLPPIVSVAGCVFDGTGSIDLHLATPNAPAALVIGTQGPGVPLFGGTLWPNIVTIGVVFTGPAGAGGFASLSLPVTLPPMVGQFAMQAIVLDAAAEQGVALSNAFTMTLAAQPK